MSGILMHRKKILNNLIKKLKSLGYKYAASEVNELSEWDESWHEEAVKEFGGEPISEEQYLEENISNVGIGDKSHYVTISPKNMFSMPFYMEVMKAHNFKPISTGESGTSFLGEGVFGVVFRGAYNGKDSAIKIVPYGYEEDSSEIDVWNKMLKIKDSMPEEYRKHIPDIYALGKSSIMNEYNEEMKYCYIIMEVLKPLDSQTRNIISGFAYAFPKDTPDESEILKDNDYLVWLAKLCAQVFTATQVGMSVGMQNIDLSKVYKIIFDNLKDINEANINNVATMIVEYFNSLYKEMFKKNISSKKINEIIKAISMRIIGSYSLRRMPNSYYTSEQISSGYYTKDLLPYWNQHPRVTSFLKMLNYLKDKHNIEWSDVHSNNIMIGNDDNLKLIDLGYFKI